MSGVSGVCPLSEGNATHWRGKAADDLQWRKSHRRLSQPIRSDLPSGESRLYRLRIRGSTPPLTTASDGNLVSSGLNEQEASSAVRSRDHVRCGSGVRLPYAPRKSLRLSGLKDLSFLHSSIHSMHILLLSLQLYSVASFRTNPHEFVIIVYNWNYLQPIRPSI